MTLARDMAEQLLQAIRITEARAGAHGLRAAEWAALRFLARANQLSRTPSALADALAATRAATSQVIKPLEEKGFLARQRSSSDGRSVVLCVTSKGEAALESDPLGPLLKALEELDSDEQAVVGQALRRALKSAMLSLDARHIDVCRDCVFLARGVASGPNTPDLKCRLSGEMLEPPEIDLLCVYFQPAR